MGFLDLLPKLGFQTGIKAGKRVGLKEEAKVKPLRTELWALPTEERGFRGLASLSKWEQDLSFYVDRMLKEREPQITRFPPEKQRQLSKLGWTAATRGAFLPYQAGMNLLVGAKERPRAALRTATRTLLPFTTPALGPPSVEEKALATDVGRRILGLEPQRGITELAPKALRTEYPIASTIIDIGTELGATYGVMRAIRTTEVRGFEQRIRENIEAWAGKKAATSKNFRNIINQTDIDGISTRLAGEFGLPYQTVRQRLTDFVRKSIVRAAKPGYDANSIFDKVLRKGSLEKWIFQRSTREGFDWKQYEQFFKPLRSVGGAARGFGRQIPQHLIDKYNLTSQQLLNINKGIIKDLPAALISELTKLEMPTKVPEGTLEALKRNPNVYWHGSVSGDLRGGITGLHIGTRLAAKEALEARIGIPAKGEWDGTREYGKTKLAGQKTMEKRGDNITGLNTDASKEDYFPKELEYQDKTKVPMNVKPNIKPYNIIGEMINRSDIPYEDFKAGGYMAAQKKLGRAKRGYFYRNIAEDEGSISATVPSGKHLQEIKITIPTKAPVVEPVKVPKPTKAEKWLTNDEIAQMTDPERQAIIREKLSEAKNITHRRNIIMKYAHPKKLNYDYPAFQEFVDYNKDLQLPKSSKIRDIQLQMARLRGQRMSGKVSPARANARIKSLKRQLFQVAKDEGIAVRMTKGGKLELGVRKTGYYVPVEFAEYPHFQNVGMVMGGGTDITRAIQGIDGALTPKQKAALPGQAGATEKYVLWPVRDMTIQKIKLLNQIVEIRNNILGHIKPDSPLDFENTRAMKGMTASQEGRDISIKLRALYDDLIYMENFIRLLRGQDLIRYRREYSPEILRDATIWEQVWGIGKDAKDVIVPPELPDYIHPNKPFNPREMANRHGIPFEEQEISSVKLLDSYIATALKDMFNTSIIQNNKAFIQQLRTMGYDRSANLLEAWTSEAYGGIKTNVFKFENLPAKAEGAMRKFNQWRNMGIFAFNFSWTTFTQTSSFALTVGRYGAGNAMKGLTSYLSSPALREQMARDYYSYIVKAQKSGRVSAQDTNNIINKPTKQYKSYREVIEDYGYWYIEQMERALTGASIEAARLHGISKGLTGEALKNYASDGGAKTQSMYNDEDKPRILRSLLVKTGLPFQTFNFEVMNTLREWAGKTGTPPDSKVEAVWQIVRFLATASVFSAIAWKGARRRVWFDLTRMPLPFSELWLSPITGALLGEFTQSQGLVSPVQTGVNVGRGIKDIVDYGSWDRLRREMIRYGSGMFGVAGGTQWSRIVDAWIAYARGGVYEKTGKKRYSLTDPWDAVRAGFSGLYSTTGGTRYLKTRRAESAEKRRMKVVRRKATLTINRYKDLILKGRPQDASMVWTDWQRKYAGEYRNRFGTVLQKPKRTEIFKQERRRQQRERLTPEEITRRGLPGRSVKGFRKYLR